MSDRDYGVIVLDIWGSRGSRSLTPPTSEIANYTSCYSLHAGEDLYVLDGGRGLGVLSQAIASGRRFQKVKRLHLFLSHAHMDHWEGLKDATWFWENGNGLSLHVLGAGEAIQAIERGYGHPAYVPLEILASRTLKELRFSELEAGMNKRIRGWSFRTFALNHYSGEGSEKNVLETLGYRVTSPDGFVLSYLCDHEPNAATESLEDEMLDSAQVAIVDAHFAERSQHAFGHGSQEHAAELARRHPRTLVLAAHFGPTYADRAIRRTNHRYGRSRPNFALAEEGARFSYSPESGRLRRLKPRR
jgi:ribonuclease BN (tRNA processing enzyme)